MSEKSCNDCVNSYMGYGESSCVHCLRCSEYDVGIDVDKALDCPHFKNDESLILHQQKEIGQLKKKLDKAIKALEYVNDECRCECDSDGRARETLKEIRGERC